MSDQEDPEAISIFEELIADLERPHCLVTTQGPFPKIGIRPELVSESQAGDRIWSVTRKQAQKVLDTWEREK